MIAAKLKHPFKYSLFLTFLNLVEIGNPFLNTSKEVMYVSD